MQPPISKLSTTVFMSQYKQGASITSLDVQLEVEHPVRGTSSKRTTCTFGSKAHKQRSWLDLIDPLQTSWKQTGEAFPHWWHGFLPILMFWPLGGVLGRSSSGNLSFFGDSAAACIRDTFRLRTPVENSWKIIIILISVKSYVSIG